MHANTRSRSQEAIIIDQTNASAVTPAPRSGRRTGQHQRPSLEAAVVLSLHTLLPIRQALLHRHSNGLSHNSKFIYHLRVYTMKQPVQFLY
jgi:hypothetical protein